MNIKLNLNGQLVDADVDAIDLAKSIIELLQGTSSNTAFIESFSEVTATGNERFSSEGKIKDITASDLAINVPKGYTLAKTPKYFRLKGTNKVFSASEYEITVDNLKDVTSGAYGYDNKFAGISNAKAVIYIKSPYRTKFTEEDTKKLRKVIPMDNYADNHFAELMDVTLNAEGSITINAQDPVYKEWLDKRGYNVVIGAVYDENSNTYTATFKDNQFGENNTKMFIGGTALNIYARKPTVSNPQ